MGLLDKSVNTNEHACPSCGYMANAASQVDDDDDRAIPAHGDFSICARCGSINIYEGNDNNLHTRKMDKEDLERLLSTPKGAEQLARLVFMQQSIRDFWKENPDLESQMKKDG